MTDLVQRGAVAVAERTSRRGILARASRVIVGVTGGAALLNASTQAALADPVDDVLGEVLTDSQLLAGGYCLCWYSCNPPCNSNSKRMREIWCKPCCANCERVGCPEPHVTYVKCSKLSCTSAEEAAVTP